MNGPLETYALQREKLLAQIVETMSKDERFIAAWLTGSFARHEQDALSNLDLTVGVSDLHSEIICARPWQVSAQTTKERFELFSLFGQPAILHKNNNNAPEGGTFTFVMCAESAVMVDWILRPRSTAQRPPESLLLWDKVSIPVSSPAAPNPLEKRIREAGCGWTAQFWKSLRCPTTAAGNSASALVIMLCGSCRRMNYATAICGGFTCVWWRAARSGPGSRWRSSRVHESWVFQESSDGQEL
jgi:hypothetical protein